MCQAMVEHRLPLPARRQLVFRGMAVGRGWLRKEPVRLDSFLFRNFRTIIGSVRFGQSIFLVRRGSVCVFRARRGSVRFGSVCFRVRFRPVPELHASVRFGRFGSVSYSFLIAGQAFASLAVSQPHSRNQHRALWQPVFFATCSQPALSQPRVASAALRLCAAKCSCRAMPQCVANLRCEPAL